MNCPSHWYSKNLGFICMLKKIKGSGGCMFNQLLCFFFFFFLILYFLFIPFLPSSNPPPPLPNPYWFFNLFIFSLPFLPLLAFSFSQAFDPSYLISPGGFDFVQMKSRYIHIYKCAKVFVCGFNGQPNC